MISDDACRTLKKTRLKLQDHEDLLGNVVFAPDAKARRGQEAEAGIVFGMPKNDNRTETELLALFESGADERSAYTFALMLRCDGHWCQAHNLESRMPRERNR